MSARAFRTVESYQSEKITRDMLPDFLRSRGFQGVFDERKLMGSAQSQTIHAATSKGDKLAIRVKLCWRTGDSKNWYSAAQLMANIKNGDWEGSLNHFVERAGQDGVTHFLLAQSEDKKITSAALIPITDLVPIWCNQRDISKRLISEGQLGRRKKNHAMNGSSPTLWLRDDKAPEIASAIWSHSGVLNLLTIREDAISEIAKDDSDDSFFDLPGVDYSLLGADGTEKINALRSFVKRNKRVRAVVLMRAKGQCERAECGEARAYLGFLDVHHILGAEKSDRVWNCVAVCPNCHREAHFAPNRDHINAELLSLAMKWQ